MRNNDFKKILAIVSQQIQINAEECLVRGPNTGFYQRHIILGNLLHLASCKPSLTAEQETPLALALEKAYEFWGPSPSGRSELELAGAIQLVRLVYDFIDECTEVPDKEAALQGLASLQ